MGGYSTQADSELIDFLKSLARIGDVIPDDFQVLPGHEYRFRSVASRIRLIRDHHVHRLMEIWSLLAQNAGMSAYDVAAGVTWSRGWESTRGALRRLAISETLAHLNWLKRYELINRIDGPVWTWSATTTAETAELHIRASVSEVVSE